MAGSSHLSTDRPNDRARCKRRRAPTVNFTLSDRALRTDGSPPSATGAQRPATSAGLNKVIW